MTFQTDPLQSVEIHVLAAWSLSEEFCEVKVPDLRYVPPVFLRTPLEVVVEVKPPGPPKRA
jgi:hypothetical protein